MRGTILGTTLGAVAGALYALSDLNPGRGAPLDIGTSLILIACPILGAVVGYAVAHFRGSTGV